MGAAVREDGGGQAMRAGLLGTASSSVGTGIRKPGDPKG